MAGISGPKVITNGLVLALDAADKLSYPGSGTTWRDLSGNAYNGTLTNGPTFSNVNGGSIVFDGVDDCVLISGASLPIGSGDYAVEAWIYITDTTVNRTKTIFSGVNNNSFYFGIGRSYNNNINGLRIGRANILDAENCAYTFLKNVWYYVVVTRVSSTIYFYVNTQQQTTTGSGTSVYSFLQSTDATIGLGGGGLEPYYGNIAGVKTYNRSLSITEILQNFNATKSRFGY